MGFALENHYISRLTGLTFRNKKHYIVSFFFLLQLINFFHTWHLASMLVWSGPYTDSEEATTTIDSLIAGNLTGWITQNT